jgi:hypothetical protein
VEEYGEYLAIKTTQSSEACGYLGLLLRSFAVDDGGKDENTDAWLTQKILFLYTKIIMSKKCRKWFR